MTDLTALADTLDRAACESRVVPQLAREKRISLDEAYRVQAGVVARRLARGERLVGLKIGLTSEAKMRQVGVREVILGRLTDAMRIEDGSFIDLGRMIHPRVEPEIAFLLRRPLPPTSDPEGIGECVAGVAAALEIIDSRYQGFIFDLGDVVADNASSAGFVLGRWHPAETEIGDVPIALGLSDKAGEAGTSAAILGHPLRALAAAGRIAAAHGIATAAGDVVLAGAATAAIPLSDGAHVTARFGDLGRLVLHAGFAARAAT